MLPLGHDSFDKMTTQRAIEIIEGVFDPKNEQEVVNAWQHLSDTGVVWELQGWYGRIARDLIEEGIITCKDPNKMDS